MKRYPTPDLGMPEVVDMTEFVRRMDKGIYDKDEAHRGRWRG